MSEKNLAEYMGVPYIHAVGGSWLCAKADIAEGNFDKITELCRKARQISLGYEIAHVGINCDSSDASTAVCSQFERAFGFETKPGSTSNFSTSAIEVTKQIFPGANGHLAVRTNNIQRAIEDLAQKGFQADMYSAKYKGENMIAIYLKQEFGGFAVHLLQK